jgi:hypothetical protein
MYSEAFYLEDCRNYEFGSFQEEELINADKYLRQIL